MRNILDAVPKKDRKSVSIEIKAVFDAPDKNRAKRRLDEVIDRLKTHYSKAAERLSEGAVDALACLSFPTSQKKEDKDNQLP